MKISIAFSILILVLAAAFGWHGHERLASVRASHAALIAEAAALGISTDSTLKDGRPLVTKHAEREDKQAIAKDAAAKFIAFAKEMEALEKTGERPDQAMQKRIMEFMDLMMSLDTSQLKIVIAEVRAAGELKDETRQGLIGFSIMTMANDHPQAALTLFTESADLFKDNRMGDHVVSMALGRWAKDDPMGALDWVRKNGEKFPDLVTEEAKSAVISGAADQDPKLALQLIGELKLKDSSDAVRKIAAAAKTPEERSATLVALRDYAASLTNSEERQKLVDSAVSSLARSAAKEGFEAGSQWIANAGLSQKELENISGNLTHSIKSAETGQWIEWLGEKLPADKTDRNIGRIIQNWTQKDYRAAGTWLANAPEGPTKQAAVRSYAETVASYDPQTAAQWALTLPAGKKRAQTLQHIHQQWPKDDAAGAAAFAEQHGLKAR
jgi:hypothetical protein